MNAFEIINRVREHSPMVANGLLNHLVPRLIPLANGVNIRVRELTMTRCELTMPLKKKTANHVHSVYFGAQMMLADISAGVLLFQRFPLGPFSGVIKRVEADFISKGKSGLTCVSELDSEIIETLEEARTNESGKSEAWVPFQLLDDNGQLVTDVRFLVAIKRFAPRTTV